MLSWLVFKFALLSGKAASFLSQLLSIGSGEQIEGRVICSIDKNALRKLAKNKKIIVVSSTNGKTTTTRLIASALRNANFKVISNEQGANQEAGIISALTKMKNPDYCVLEIDERSLAKMFERLNPEYVLFANLSRDQLDRFGEVSSISKAWKDMLLEYNGTIVANACDPNIVFACSSSKKSKTIYVPLETSWHNDSHSCPSCGSLLNFKLNSEFSCNNCSFSTPIDHIKIEAQLKNKIEESLNIPGNWNVNNAIIAYELLVDIPIDDETIIDSYKTISSISGRNEIFKLNKKQIQLFLAKNPAGWNETLEYIKSHEKLGLIFAFNCNIADGKDPSWLYDVDFESIPLKNIFVFGERATDMATRLMIANKKPIVVNDLNEALNKSTFEFNLLIASYTQFLKLSRKLSKSGSK